MLWGSLYIMSLEAIEANMLRSSWQIQSLVTIQEKKMLWSSLYIVSLVAEANMLWRLCRIHRLVRGLRRGVYSKGAHVGCIDVYVCRCIYVCACLQMTWATRAHLLDLECVPSEHAMRGFELECASSEWSAGVSGSRQYGWNSRVLQCVAVRVLPVCLVAGNMAEIRVHCSVLHCAAVCGRRPSMAKIHTWHDSFIYATWLIHMCDMTHSYMWHDAFIYVHKA